MLTLKCTVLCIMIYTQFTRGVGRKNINDAKLGTRTAFRVFWIIVSPSPAL